MDEIQFRFISAAQLKFALVKRNWVQIPHKSAENVMPLEKTISEVFSIPESTVLNSLALSEIPTWDSLAHMLFVVRLEEVYQIQFTGDEIADFKTVGDTRAALLAHGVKL